MASKPEMVIEGIDFGNRSVDRIFLQGQIIAFLTSADKNGMRFNELRTILKSDFDSINVTMDEIARNIELCTAPTQLQKEDGTITIVGNLGCSECYIQISHAIFDKKRH